MKPSTRERVLRTLLAAFINSSLTPLELEGLSEEIFEDPKLREDLRRVLWAASSALRDEPTQKEWHLPEGSSLDHVLDLVKRRRYSKDEVLRTINRVAPSLMSKSQVVNRTLREVVRDFWMKATSDERSRFISSLAPNDPAVTDEYLQGIFKTR